MTEEGAAVSSRWPGNRGTPGLSVGDDAAAALDISENAHGFVSGGRSHRM